MKNKILPVTIKICNVTGSPSNNGLLWELSKAGVKNGDEVNGLYNSITGSVQFSKNESDCVAWVNETCLIIESK